MLHVHGCRYPDSLRQRTPYGPRPDYRVPQVCHWLLSSIHMWFVAASRSLRFKAPATPVCCVEALMSHSGADISRDYIATRSPRDVL
jgi:hypothetical protein